MIAPIVCNKLTAPPLGDAVFGGYPAVLADRLFQERVNSDFARNVVYRETEDAFRNKIDDQTIVGIWQGEYWGKWIISASRVARYQHNDGLKDFIRQAAHDLLSLQEEDGYLGTYRDPKNVFAPSEEAIRAIGGGSRWNWNLWCRKYTLWGLLEAYMLTGDGAILQGAVRFADQYIRMLDENGIDPQDTGTFYGTATLSILKPMVILYAQTEDRKYLEFAVRLAEMLNDRETNRCPNFLVNAFSGKPLHEWYPDIPSPRWAKAYESMSLMDGLLELYRYTGIALYFDAVKAIWDLLYKYEFNTVQSVGYNDVFANASAMQNALSEPCDAVHWLRMTYELFTLTGDAKYMDVFERTFCNAYLAAIEEDGRWGSRCVRSSTLHYKAPPQAKMKYNHCCVNNLPRGFMNMAQAMVMDAADGVYVNLYTGGSVRLPDGTVTVSGSYLTDGRVRIESTCGRPLFLRIPDWSRTTVIGGSVTKAHGCYVRVDGAEAVDVTFDLNPRVVPFAEAVERLPADDWRYRRYVISDPETEAGMVWERGCTAFKGPVLLAKGGSSAEPMTVCEIGGMKLRDYATAGKYREGDAHDFTVILPLTIG